MKLLIITPLPDDRTLKNLKDLCPDLKYLAECSEPDLIDELKSGKYDIIYTNPNKQSFTLNEYNLNGSSVKIICTVSTGTNHIDLKYCKKNKIEVISLTKDSVIHKISSTAEHALGLMLSLIRDIPSAMNSVKDGQWDWESHKGRQLNHLTIGIVGFGRLGKMMANFCESLGMKVYVYDPHITPIWIPQSNIEHVDTLSLLFKKCDVISLHVHLTDETRFMINSKILKNSKVSYLINTSRGDIVNESDIAEAILDGSVLKGYATDVLSDELDNKSNIYDNELVTMMRDGHNIIITPHIGGMTKEARILAHNAIIESLHNKLNGLD